MSRARDVATQGGLVLITKTSFTSATQIDILNCFSSRYKNYKLILSPTSGSASSIYVSAQLLSGTTPASGSDYFFGVRGLSASGGSQDYSLSATTSMFLFDLHGSYGPVSICDTTISSPFTANRTGFILLSSSHNSAAMFGRAGAGQHIQDVSYDGLRIITSGGNMTGIVTVYGIKD